MTYPLEDDSLKNKIEATFRDVVYSKLDEMKRTLKTVPIQVFTAITKLPEAERTEAKLDAIVQQILESAAFMQEKQDTAFTYLKEYEAKQVIKLQQ
mmetsp:Transcript_33164/g.50825  ORF Transcript_33164/g.50825 Transcript_33164/m.50825 type:complete len:96 (+) Transcript_33164:1060-1347(+)